MIDVKILKSKASGLTVLYVEDEELVRESVSNYLHKIFASVDVAKDGEDGFKKYQEKHYDIVVTDIQMPKISGLVMSEQMRDIHPEQEILIISAFTNTECLMDAIKLGISGYIIKPVSYDQMNAALYQSVNKVMLFKENMTYKQNLEKMVQERSNAILNLQQERYENYEKTLESFVSMVDERDTYTGGHSQRVATYCRLIAQEMGYSDSECDMMYKAGILHDIGKISTPDSILLKPSKLTDLEYKLVVEHVTIGYNLLSNIPMYKDIAEIMLCHHERHDGKGYPKGIKGDEIPVFGRIIKVADSFDAMTTSRIYKTRVSLSQAMKELKDCSGSEFHPEVVESAIKALQHVEPSSSITQLPQTYLEKERFSYFYKDQITQAYNVTYLDVVLNANRYEKEYKSIQVLYLHNFGAYNKEHSWSAGNQLLSDFVDYLSLNHPKSIIFRFHGDDFVLISKDKLSMDENSFKTLEMLAKNRIHVSTLHINLEEKNICSLKELEAIS